MLIGHYLVMSDRQSVERHISINSLKDLPNSNFPRRITLKFTIFYRLLSPAIQKVPDTYFGT